MAEQGPPRDVTAADLLLLSQILAASPIPYVAAQADGKLFAFNQAFCDLLGYAPTELARRNMIEHLTPPPWRSATRKVHERLKAGAPPQPYQKELLRSDGELVPVELFVHQVVGRDGLIYYWSFVSDISARRQAENALKEEEARYRAMVEAIDGFVYVCSPDMKIEFMNQRLKERAGRDATGEPCHQALHDLESPCPWCVNDLIQRGESANWEIQSPKDQRWYSVVNTPIGHADGSVSKQAIITDITARKQAEQALKESESKFRSLTETAASAILIIQDGVYRYVNPAALHLTGYSEAELVGMEYLGLVHAEHQAIVKQRHLARLEGATAPARYQIKLVRKDGQERWVDFTAARIEYEGAPAILGTAVDVTEQRLAMEAVLSSERRLADIVSFLPDPTFAVDRQGVVIAWNRALEELTQIRAEDMLGKGDYEYALPFYGVRRPILVDLCMHWDQDASRRYPFVTQDNHTLLTEVELDRFRPGGVVLWGKAAPLFDTHGEMFGAIETIRDISDHKRLEARLRDLAERREALVNSLPLGVISVDGDFRVTELNAQGERILGISQAEALNRPCWEVLKGAPCQDRCPIKSALAGQLDPTPLETTIQHAQKGAVPVRLTAARLHDAEGNIVGGVEVFQDISELKALERERANLVSMFAHDMRSPLVSIQGFALRLLSEAAKHADDRGAKYLDIIRKEAAKLEGLINEFLDFSRLELGRLSLNFGATDLVKELLELVEVYEERCRAAGFTLATKLGEGIPVIEADAPRLRRVFTNLLDNAIKYSTAGTTITLECDQTEQEVLVRVRDQGIGIAAEELPYIFDVFYRGHNHGKREGYGLGLAGAEAIVKGHGGRVMVFSELGKGSVFTIALPRQRPAPAGEDNAATSVLP